MKNIKIDDIRRKKICLSFLVMLEYGVSYNKRLNDRDL